MAKDESGNALAQFAPVGAPALGVVLAIVFIAAVVMTSGISENKDALQKSITTVSTRMSSTEVEAPDWGQIPNADSVNATMATASKGDWKPGFAEPLLKLPVKWQVELQEKPKSEFEGFDLNGDKFLSREEFARIPAPANPLRAKFENWDRWGNTRSDRPDGLISREEFDDPPRDTMEQWTESNTNNDEYLDAQDGEITEEEEYAWDTYPYDGKIDYAEYEGRFGERAERELGPVSNVTASVDPATMEIVVTWDEPSLGAKPEDIVYMIERFAPETYDARDSAYKREMADWMKVWGEWNNKFQKWLNQVNPADPDGKKNRDKFPRDKWKDQFPEKEPTEPTKPELWERVMDPNDDSKLLLVNGTEHRDRSFDTGITYTYAVTMVTQKNPARGQRAEPITVAGEKWFKYPDRVQQQGHPALVRNRVEMRWKSQAGQSGTMTLAKWHRIGKDWYKVRITQSLEANDSVGGDYNKSQLSDMSGVLIDVNGTEVDIATLPDGDKVDLSTGFSFVTNTARGFLINSRELGDFELPRATAQEASEKDDAAGKDNPIEVRALTVKNGGSEGMFEVTRWHQVGEEWLRVVWRGSVSKGKDVGGSVNLASPGKDVTVYDASGNKVTKKYEGTVDLAAGTYDGLDGRTVTVGGEAFDLFGTLYKE